MASVFRRFRLNTKAVVNGPSHPLIELGTERRGLGCWFDSSRAYHNPLFP